MNVIESLAFKSAMLDTLVMDINRMIVAREKGETDRSRRSLENMTKLRKPGEAKEAAKRDKDVQFVIDQLDKIFGE